MCLTNIINIYFKKQMLICLDACIRVICTYNNNSTTMVTLKCTHTHILICNVLYLNMVANTNINI